MNQANALATSFANEKFTAILTSPLNRALSTASAIHDRQAPPRPPIIQNDLLKEQHFGEGEGKPYTAARTGKTGTTPASNEKQDRSSKLQDGTYARNRGDDERFPGGESRREVRERADKTVEELLLPYIGLEEESERPTHILVVSHGIYIRHLVGALVKRGTLAKASTERITLHNTGWVRVVVEKEGDKLTMSITEVNRHDHLNSLVRQKGGIGSSAHDPRQKDLRAFFGGGKARTASAQKRSERR
ncbi:phosphoglycerate mutase-like protein [Schizophyllum commune H4-8]|nr:phosphoglycerate mutase-like protein [Schizophyllum commune H4-8]KAI5896815.1 phosphoglycerate mutase-like protein [Schizophyllum commune H4-8]